MEGWRKADQFLRAGSPLHGFRVVGSEGRWDTRLAAGRTPPLCLSLAGPGPEGCTCRSRSRYREACRCSLRGVRLARRRRGLGLCDPSGWTPPPPRSPPGAGDRSPRPPSSSFAFFFFASWASRRLRSASLLSSLRFRSPSRRSSSRSSRRWSEVSLSPRPSSPSGHRASARRARRRERPAPPATARSRPREVCAASSGRAGRRGTAAGSGPPRPGAGSRATIASGPPAGLRLGPFDRPLRLGLRERSAGLGVLPEDLVQEPVGSFLRLLARRRLEAGAGFGVRGLLTGLPRPRLRGVDLLQEPRGERPPSGVSGASESISAWIALQFCSSRSALPAS